MAFSPATLVRGPGDIAAMVVDVLKIIFTKPFQFRSSWSRPGSSPA